MKVLPVPPPHSSINNKPNAYMAEVEPDPVTAVYFTDFTGQDYGNDDVADVYVAVETR